ncbi:MAG: lipase family protein [Gordonia sp. (in: high G+C Gram-positive bacteria)]
MRQQISRAVVGLVVIVGLVAGLGGASGAGAATAAPGTRGDLVSVTDITSQPDSRIAGAARVLAIGYLTENVHGDVVEATASVSIPKRKPGPNGYRIMAFNHGTNGLGDSCAQSSQLGEGGKRDSWLGPWLTDGYVLTATDYAGLGGPGLHAYLSGRTAGKNVLDAVRATRTVVARYTDSTAPGAFVPFGGSQGGAASLWTGSLARSYAPELTPAGVIAHSVPTDLDQVFSAIAPGVPPVAAGRDYPAYVSYIMAGLNEARPDVDVPSYLTPLGRKLLREAETACYRDFTAATAKIPVGDLAARPFSEGPLIAALRDYTATPTGGFTSPILLQQGLLDTSTFAPMSVGLADQLRAGGATVDYRTYPQRGHGLSVQEAHESRAWADALPTWPAGTRPL